MTLGSQHSGGTGKSCRLFSKTCATFIWVFGALIATLFLTPIGQAQQPETAGPVVGHVGTDVAYLWYRPGLEGFYLARVWAEDKPDVVVSEAVSQSSETDDFCCHFRVPFLSSGTSYIYGIYALDASFSESLVAGGQGSDCRFKTWTPPGSRDAVTIDFGSCANFQAEPTFARMESEGADALVLLGDTPYCDNSHIPTCRKQQRDFLRMPPLASMLRKTPMWSTWDDHDFGFNDSNGLSHSLKANNRQVFLEYRAQESFGTGTEGVYTKFSCGPADIFMLDARWVSRTAPSPADPETLTALGATQWQWLLRGLLDSRAAFKVLVSGMVWDDKGNAEIDDWYTYYRERDALFDFIRDQHVSGVICIAGDVHVSRHVVRRQRVGYDLNEFVTSPLHGSVISYLDRMDLGRIWGEAAPYTYLRITFDSLGADPSLTARFLTADGSTLRTVLLKASELESLGGSGLARQLRAYWNFEEGGRNTSSLGSRLDLSPRRGASLVSGGSVRPGVCTSLSQPFLQYWIGTSQVLPEMTTAMTLSLWFRPSTLPYGSQRMTACQSTWGQPIDLFLSASSDSDYVVLTAQSMNAAGVWIGPASTQIHRSILLNSWTHVTMRYNGDAIHLFLNGALVGVAQRPPSALRGLSSDSGLTIGGTWNGVSTFDGLIDEVAVWDRALENSEILELVSNGSPPPVPTTVSRPDLDHDGLPDDWERSEGLNPLDPNDAMDDNDDDGMSNLLEFALAGNPRAANACPCEAVVVVRDGQRYPALQFPKRNSDNLGYLLEISDDLVSWQPDFSQEIGDAQGDTSARFEIGFSPLRQIRASTPLDAKNRRFMRLRVSNGPVGD